MGLAIYPEARWIWTGSSVPGAAGTVLLTAILVVDAFIIAAAFGTPIYLFMRLAQCSDEAGHQGHNPAGTKEAP